MHPILFVLTEAQGRADNSWPELLYLKAKQWPIHFHFLETYAELLYRHQNATSVFDFSVGLGNANLIRQQEYGKATLHTHFVL